MQRIGSEDMNKLTGKKNTSKASSNTTAKRNYFNPYTTNTTTRQSEFSNLSNNKVMNTTRINKEPGGKSAKQKDTNSRERVVKNKKTMGSNNKKFKSSDNVHRTITSDKRTKNPKINTPQNKQLARVKRKRQRKIKQVIAIAQLVLVMVGTTCVVWAFFNVGNSTNSPKVSYQTVRMGSIDDSTNLEGVILRNEEVIYGGATDNIRYVVPEGDKVKKDGMVYVIVDEPNLETSIKEQSQINKQIYDKAEQRQNISYYQDDIYNINELLGDDFDIFYDNIYQDTTNFVYALRGDLEKNIGERTNLYTKEQEGISESIVAQKEEILANINKYQIGKTAPKAGIISYQIDGKETKDAVSLLGKFDYKEYKQLNDKVKSNEKEISQPIYKIILDNKWYIVSYIEEDTNQDFKQGETYNLYFEHNTKEVPFKLKSVTKEGDTKTKLVFESSDQVGEFLDRRSVKFSIGEREVSGIKIPKESIVEQNMIKIPLSYTVKKDSNYGVHRQKGDMSEYVEIDIEYKKEDYLYVRQDIGDLNKLQINDVLLEPTNTNTPQKYKLDEIETVQGVYAINGSIAEFKTIAIELLSSEYAIVDEEGATELKVGDKIISNPKSIEIDQLIKDVQNE